ncbi:helix-turn-helix domain-containing protein [Arthrobacter halodurans]|uniref:Helix-turn-helix domain-containing protein n=1 Tax=Arthrobacter halodurans TaxID=516699 RepID=A0ABV4UK39_9MICC
MQTANDTGCLSKERCVRSYHQLMKQGMGNSEACRIVGISRNSGIQRPHSRTVVQESGDIKRYAPISRQKPAVVSAGFLSESERITIADLLQTRRSIRAIAMELARNPSTVSREIRRNDHESSGNYRPRTGQRNAERRRSRTRTGRMAGNLELKEFVREQLKQRWSPRQISTVAPTSWGNRKSTLCLIRNSRRYTGRRPGAFRGSGHFPVRRTDGS